MEQRIIEEIIEHHRGQKVVLLAPTPEAALRLKNCYCFTGRETDLHTATPVELALEVLEPDINMRGLKVIPNDKLIDILAKIAASLAERGELSRFGDPCQITSLLPGIYENIIKMRRSSLKEQVLAAEWGNDSSSLLGLIRNEYELNLEVWGCLDEAAVFCQAAALLEAGIIDGSGRIIVVTQETCLDPVVLDFLKTLMEHGCQRGYSIELLIPRNTAEGEVLMRISQGIPPFVEQLMDELLTRGFSVSIVGGSVRDLLMGRRPQDFDLVTSASISQLNEIFPRVVPVGEKHGTLVILIDNEKVEISCCRGEIYQGDDWPVMLTEDLRHRDFTINAMAVDRRGLLYDPFGGCDDIARRLIRSPQDEARERFNEDPLRMLRAVRLAAVLNFELDQSVACAINQCQSLLAGVAVERIREELNSILLSERPDWGMRTLVDTGLMQYVVPEILPTVGFEQHNRAHLFDVFTHSLAVLSKVPANLELRLAALLHDAGKPATFTLDDRGVGHFYQHQQESCRLGRAVLTRMKYSNAVIDKVCRLVGEHMIWLENPSEEKIRRLIGRVGKELLPELFTLQRADIMGSAPPFELYRVDRVQSMAEATLSNDEALTIKDLAVDGFDLIQIGYLPGEDLGRTLNALLEIVLASPAANQKEVLLQTAASWLQPDGEKNS
ncbi:MAG: HD domain-containing protein [Syntrophomonas sp.]